MKTICMRLVGIVDLLMAPFLVPSALLMKAARRIGVQRLPLCRKLLLHIGVFPVRSHYYEPLFDYRFVDLEGERNLPALDLREVEQLGLLSQLNRGHEITTLFSGALPARFSQQNSSFGPGDAEVWYQMIRHLKPRRIYEVGSGNSTMVAQLAIAKNKEELSGYACRHICIEPYEMPWLEASGVTVLRQTVESVDPAFFGELGAGDLLFIDSSHIIRPGGDVLCLYQHILPILKAGVTVHIHDIFTPRHYPQEWRAGRVRFWNEQYLLEAFLAHNGDWEVVAAVNFLHHAYPERLREVAPHLHEGGEPGSFYIRRRLEG